MHPVAKARRKHTLRDLDDVVRFLVEQRGREKNPGLGWEIKEQVLLGRIKLRRHWKRNVPRGDKIVRRNASKVCDPSHFRSVTFDFDHHDRLKPMPEFGDNRLTLVEPCDLQAIFPPLAAHLLPDHRPEASPKSATALLPPLSKELNRTLRRRQTKYDWDEICGEIARLCHDEWGLVRVPENESELAEKVLQFCEDDLGCQPADSELRKTVKVICARLRKVIPANVSKRRQTEM
jgi:hypothetical protein